MLSFQQYLEEKISTVDIEKRLWGAVDSALDARKKPQFALKTELRKFMEEMFPMLKHEISIKTNEKEEYAGVSYIYNKNTGEITGVVLNVLIPKKIFDKEGVGNLVATLMHEITHLYQMKRSEFNSILKADPKSLKPTTDPNNYLANNSEVEAWAVNAVGDVMKFAYNQNFMSSFSFKKFEQTLSSKEEIKRMKKVSDSIRMYWNFFGRHEDDAEKQKVWQRFLKKLYQHIQDRIEDQQET